MRNPRFIAVLFILSFASFACSKKKKSGDVAATLMKANTATSLATSELPLTMSGSGSMVQSFTPTSLKIAIFAVSLCGDSGCSAVYSCGAGTVAGCGVELSKIDAFVDALNSGSSEVEEGSYDHISVQFCPNGDSSGMQYLTINGTVKIQGVDYATDPTSGLVAGTSGKDTSISIKGGCASYYPISANVSKGTTTTVRMFFDASFYTYGGVDGGNSSLNSYYDSSCVGSSSAYVCGQVTTVVATVDSGTPTTERYLVANTDSDGSNNSPTASIVLYFGSDGSPIGGVQNYYRTSGSSVTWGRSMGGGLGLYPTVVDAGTVEIGKPGGSISLANWFKTFKRSTHTGTYTYSASSSQSDGAYSATKL